MKGREFGKEAAQIFVSGARDIAGGKDRSEDQKYAAKLTQPKTDSSGCFGISMPEKELKKLIAAAETIVPQIRSRL